MWSPGWVSSRMTLVGSSMNANRKGSDDGSRVSEYALFKEVNDWEGEEWSFYIPVDGNEEALGQLAAWCHHWRAKEPEFPYSSPLLKWFSADQVEKFVTTPNSGATYMAAHNQMAGTLAIPENLLELEVKEAFTAFYKGGMLECGLTIVASCPEGDDDDDEWDE